MPAARSSSGYTGGGPASNAGGSSTDHQSAGAAGPSLTGPVPPTSRTGRKGSMGPPGSIGGSLPGGTDGASIVVSGGPGISRVAPLTRSRSSGSGQSTVTGMGSLSAAGASVAHTAPATITAGATPAITPLG